MSNSKTDCQKFASEDARPTQLGLQFLRKKTARCLVLTKRYCNRASAAVSKALLTSAMKVRLRQQSNVFDSASAS